MKQSLFSFSLIAFLHTLPIFILSIHPVAKTIYRFTDAQQNQTAKLSSISEDLLRQTLEYLGNSEKTYQLNIQKSTDFQLTISEQSHMSDVKHLFFMAKILLIISFLLSAYILLTSKLEHRKELFVSALSAMKYLLLILVLLSLATIFFWDQIFTTFHMVFFPQGNWAFSADSLIIQLFPDQFWWGIGMGYLTMVGIELTVFWIFLKKLIPTLSFT